MARGLYRHPPQPTQRGKFVQPPVPVVGCYHDEVIADSPTAYWRLGEPSGTNANDEIGTADGTYTNTPTLGTTSLLSGDSNTAITLAKASDQYVTVPSSGPVDQANGAFTWEIAFTPTAGMIDATTRYLMMKGAAGTSAPTLSVNGASAALEFRSDGWGDGCTSSTTIVAGTTYFVVATRSAGNVWKLYVNGSDVTVGSGTPSTATDAGALLIGRYSTGSANNADGVIDEVAVYKGIALGADRIATHYAARLVACVCYHDAVIADGPKGYWRLGESSGNPQDSSGNAHHVTTTGGTPTYSQSGALSGDSDTSITFDGSTEYFEIANHADLHPGNTITIEAWFKRANSGNTHFIWDNGSGDAELYILSDDKVYFGRSGIATLLVSSGTYADTNWHHVVAVKDGSTSRALYIDGVSVGTGGTDSTLVAAGGASRIGATLGGSNFLNGTLDEVAVYSTALTAAQVTAHYAARLVACTGGSTVFGAIAEAVTSSDAWTRSMTALRGMTEAVQSSDAWTRSGTFLRAWASSVASSDVVSRSGTFLRAWAGAVQSADAWVGVKVFARDFTSSVTSSDAWTRSGTFLRSMTESVGSGDAWTRAATFARALASGVTSADVWSRSGTFLRSFAEAVQSADVWTAVKVFLRDFASSVTSSDAWTRSGTFARTWTGAVTQSDAWTRSGTFLRALGGAVASFDTWVGIKTGAVLAAWSEAVTSSDTWTRSGTFLRGMAESVASAVSMAGSTASLVIGGIGPTISAAVSMIVQAAAHTPIVGALAHGHRPHGQGWGQTSTPRVETAYVYTPAIDTGEVAAVLAELKSIGVNTVILSETREKSGGCASNSYAWTSGNPSNIGLWLYEANQLGMGLYVGLVFSAGTCSVFHAEPNTSQDATDAGTTVDTVVTTWGGGHPALRGWSIVNEAALAYHTDPTILADHHAYYAAQVAAIRAHSALPIITAPYLGGVYSAWNGSVQTPAQVATKASNFAAATGVTVQVWQDSLGSELAAFDWTRQAYHVADYYEAIGTALGDAAFWTDNELFTSANPQFSGPGYHPAPMARLAHSISAGRRAGRRAVFLAQYHMGTAEGGHVADSPRLLAAFKSWYGFGGEYIRPVGYTWQTTPLAAYPDSGGQLTDLVTGDPLNHADLSWVGVGPNPRFTLDLGTSKALRWVGVHVMHLAAQSISLPDSIKIETSADGVTFASQGTFALAVSKSDGEFVIANTTVLSASGRYVRVTLANAGTTFLSEVEVIGA